MRILCVIPARLESTRLKKKMLQPLNGKPLIQNTYEAAKRVELFDEVVVAVDSQELLDVVNGFGGTALLTEKTCESGTDRLVELCTGKVREADIWVNWQGDEPFISPKAIDDLLQDLRLDEEIWTLKTPITNEEEIRSPHVVKVVCDARGRALYFSRSPIPYCRGEASYFKHVGLYAYRASALKKIAILSSCPAERAEKLEQLRFLYYNLPITVHETAEKIFGIDTAEELLIAQSSPDLLY